jgi:7-carboxy-7-deazaguanine synthase
MAVVARETPAAAPGLRMTEIFFSLQGEARTVGWPTVFVRLTGCPLRCGYCDTAYAFHGGVRCDLDSIVAEVAPRAPGMSASPAASRWRTALAAPSC